MGSGRPSSCHIHSRLRAKGAANRRRKTLPNRNLGSLRTPPWGGVGQVFDPLQFPSKSVNNSSLRAVSMSVEMTINASRQWGHERLIVVIGSRPT